MRAALSFERESIIQLDIRTLSDLMLRPELLRKPNAVLPRIAYSGRATLLSAREKFGKTTLLANAAARLSNGDTWLDEPTTRTQTLWLTEEHLGDVVRRFKRMGAAPDWIDIAPLPMDGSPTDRVAAIAMAVAEGDYGLVVVDTLAALMSGLTSQNDSAEVSRVMNPLCAIAHHDEAALILSAHANKGERAGYRGSSEIGARVDVIVEMEGGSAPSHRRLRILGRLGVDEFELRFNGEEYHLGGHELSVDMQVLEFVVTHPGTSANAVEKAVPGAAGAKRRAIKTLTKAGRIRDQFVKKGKKIHHSLFAVGFESNYGTTKANVSDEAQSLSLVRQETKADEGAEGPTNPETNSAADTDSFPASALYPLKGERDVEESSPADAPSHPCSQCGRFAFLKQNTLCFACRRKSEETQTSEGVT